MTYSTEPFNGNQHMYDTFIQNSKNGTIFHEMKFLSYHGDRFDTNYLLTKKGNSPMGVMAGVPYQDDDKLGFIAHRGSTFGGPVIKNGGGYAYTNKIIGSMLQYLKDENYDYLQFRLTPSHLCETQAEEVEFEILHRGGKMLPPEMTTFIQLTNRDHTFDEILNSFSSRARRAYKKADKNEIEFKWNDPDFETYHDILEETLDERYSTDPTHSLEELKLLKNKYPNRIFLASGYMGDEMVTGAVIMLLNNISAHAFYFATRQDKYHLGGLNKVVPLSIFELNNQYGILNINLGISSGKLGKSVNSGLFRFKEGFHNRNILRKTFRIEL